MPQKMDCSVQVVPPSFRTMVAQGVGRFFQSTWIGLESKVKDPLSNQILEATPIPLGHPARMPHAIHCPPAQTTPSNLGSPLRISQQAVVFAAPQDHHAIGPTRQRAAACRVDYLAAAGCSAGPWTLRNRDFNVSSSPPVFWRHVGDRFERSSDLNRSSGLLPAGSPSARCHRKLRLCKPPASLREGDAQESPGFHGATSDILAIATIWWSGSRQNRLTAP